MADTQHDPIIERLDRLEAALLRLVSLVEARGLAAAPVRAPAPPAPVASLPPVAPGEPPRIKVAPARGAPPPQAEPAAAPPAEGLQADLPEIAVPGPEGSVSDVITRLFEAALEPDPEVTWATLAKLFHSGQLAGPRAIDHFKGFAWQRLRRNARVYLVDGDPRSFQIAYTDPREPTGAETEMRVFIKAGDNRMPVPLGLSRDPARAGAWRVTMMSL